MTTTATNIDELLKRKADAHARLHEIYGDIADQQKRASQLELEEERIDREIAKQRSED